MKNRCSLYFHAHCTLISSKKIFSLHGIRILLLCHTTIVLLSMINEHIYKSVSCRINWLCYGLFETFASSLKHIFLRKEEWTIFEPFVIPSITIP